MSSFFRNARDGEGARREDRQDEGPPPSGGVLAGSAQGAAATVRVHMQRETWPAARIAVRTGLHAGREGVQYGRGVVTLGATVSGLAPGS
ncbi:hypothetical protein ACU7M0_36110, partial [Burkholderia cenocepacia]